jgi:hypothetical protein
MGDNEYCWHCMHYNSLLMPTKNNRLTLGAASCPRIVPFSKNEVFTLVLYVCFVDRYLSFCTFIFGHCVVCSSINGF